MMDEPEDAEEILQRLQREVLASLSEGSGDKSRKPYTPSYCYGCARTAGVAVCRRPLSKKQGEQKKASPPNMNLRSHNYGQQRHTKPRINPHLKGASNRQVSARIKKKALSTLLQQKTGKANDQSVAENGVKKSMSRNRPDRRGVFACDECGQVFTFRNNLKRHQQRHVAQAKKYHCAKCGEIFSVEKAYLQHMQHHKPVGTATSDRPYACDECDKTFSRPVSLCQHKKIHNTAKPYSCRYCPRRFKTSYNLSFHEDTHMNIKPYPCQYCGMAFTRNCDRMVHERSHTTERRFKCDKCSRTFTRGDRLRTHQKTHT